MSRRRFLFVLAATVVMLYFSVILFIMHPLHARGYGLNSYYFRKIPNLNWCRELKWVSPPKPYVVALASYPGSGNTWLRYLLQQATGLFTGSIYMDHGLRLHGFPGENVTDGSVLVVKTHEMPPLESNRYKSAVILIRDPRDAILADFNRLHKGHIGTAPKSAFKTKAHENHKSDWEQYVSRQVSVWEAMNTAWLHQYRGAALVLSYERLVTHTGHTLARVLHFLSHNYTEADLTCALANREGIYRRRRKHKDFDPFTPKMYEDLRKARTRVMNIVHEFYMTNNLTGFGGS